MKKTLLLSAALLAVLAGPALAQRDNRGRGPEGAPQAQQSQPQQNFQRDRNPANRPDFNRGGDAARPGADRGNFAERDNGPRPDFNRDGRDDDRRPGFNRGGNDNRYDGRFDGRRDFGRNDRFDNNRRWDNDRGWSNNWYDGRRFSGYYRSWNAPSRFRAGTYYRPQGFYYRRWSYGDILPSLFWSNRYWLSNYYSYDLPRPPVGTVWVRYGSDALLIDRYTGEVIQVAYDIFW
jgi:Ni/Co efflux regulator RcnB